MNSYTLDINGFEIEAQYSEDNVQNIFLPLIFQLEKLQKEKGRRIFVFMAAPAGLGKTTLAVFLESLAKENGCNEFLNVGIDGYHYYNDYLNTHSILVDGKEVLLKTIKGNKDTFDVDKMEKNLESLQNEDGTWPLYSRQLHEPVENAVVIDKKIVFIEGNYLLLKDKRWERLMKYCDYSIFIKADPKMLESRLVERKAKGGTPYNEALEWVKRSDMVNVLTILNESRPADMTLFYDGETFRVEGK